MQAVILAAGKGTRMGGLTKDTPKPMLKVAGKPFIEYVLNSLPASIDEVILVIGYLGEQIEKHIGPKYFDRKVKYIWQDELTGTGAALWLAKGLLHGKFFVQYADDVYATEDLERCIKEDRSLLVLKQEKLVHGGKVIMDEAGTLKDIVESDNHGGEPGVFNCGVYVLQPDIFKYELVKVQDKKELGLPQTIVAVAKDHPIKVIETTRRISITHPQDIEKAEGIIATWK